MNTDTGRAHAADLARWYVPGPLDPDSLAAALKVARTVSVGDSTHDVWTLFDTMNEAYGTDFDRGEFAQLARAVLYALVGIGGLEAKDPIRALQLWRSRNTASTLAWAFGQALSLISQEHRAEVQQDQSARSGAA